MSGYGMRIGIGWLLAASVVGCNSSAPVGPKPGDQVHAHPEHGPHEGELVAFDGAPYHAEFVTEGDKVTVYMLDQAAKNSVAVAVQEPVLHIDIHGAEHEFTFAASPQAEDAEGKTTRFELQEEELAEALGTAAIESAHFAMTLDGKQLEGKFEHGHHGHGHSHGHDHGEDDILVWHGGERELAGHTIQVGQHGLEIHRGEEFEPAVTVNGADGPVETAVVAVSILGDDGTTVLVEEKQLVFEPETDEEEAHFASVAFAVPEDSEEVLIRYRVELPGEAGSENYDVRLKTTKH